MNDNNVTLSQPEKIIQHITSVESVVEALDFLYGDEPLLINNAGTIEKIIAAYNATGDKKAIRTALSDLKPAQKQSVFDKPVSVGKGLDLLKHIEDDHILKRIAINASGYMSIPRNTLFLMGLGVFSSVSSRAFKVNYPHVDSVPIGLFIISEQPSGTGKTRTLKYFQKPFFELKNTLEIERNKKRAHLISKAESKTATDFELEELEELNETTPVLFTTNATAEGLERLLPVNNGFFSAVSSEKGLFNSLFGKTYSNGVSNNDLVLNSFDAGYISVSRVTRDGFSGAVAGAVVCFAQDGSIDMVVNDSNGTGLSERFLMILEPHMLGTRDHEKKHFVDFELEKEYAAICGQYADVLEHQPRFEEIAALNISDNGWSLIAKLKNELEPHLANGKKLSHNTLRGAVPKLEIQIMKIAANLHLMAKGRFYPTIDDKYVISAINIAKDLLYVQYDLLHEKGIIGVKAEFSAILDYLAKVKRATATEIKQAKRNTLPFKTYTGNVSEAIDKTLIDMEIEHLISRFTIDTKVFYSIE